MNLETPLAVCCALCCALVDLLKQDVCYHGLVVSWLRATEAVWSFLPCQLTGYFGDKA